MSNLTSLNKQITTCRKCPRLVAWREEVARTRRAAYANFTYWGRPVPGFGDPGARLVVVGLAPGAHGANRTGRVFTGDRSGDWLYRALYQAGFANIPTSTDRDDGLTLNDAYVTGVLRCAPPANKPSSTERDRCLPYLAEEMRRLTRARVVVALGGLAWDGVLRLWRYAGMCPSPKPRFQHGGEIASGDMILLGCYHPSQQNTFTGRLTESMMADVFARAGRICS